MIARRDGIWSWWFTTPPRSLPIVSLTPLTPAEMPTSAALCAEADVTADASAFADWLGAHCIGESNEPAAAFLPPVDSLSVARLSVASRQTWRPTIDRIAAIDELQRRYIAASSARLVKLAREYERP